MADTNGTTRRGFLGRLGAAAALAAVPGACAAHGGAATGSGLDTVTALGEALRAAYLAELARFAEALRPRFASGELRAYRDVDDRQRIPGTTGWGDECFTHSESPQYLLGRIVGEHFGIEWTEDPTSDGGVRSVGDSALAYAILAASPHADVTGEGADHPCDHACESVAWDVIAYARERGWYAPAEDEHPDPMDEAAENLA